MEFESGFLTQDTSVSAADSNGDQGCARRLGQLQALPLAGTVGALSPFFSPDGEWLAFFADGKLKKISVAGGAVTAATTLADAPSGRGGAWGDDGNIVFTPDSVSGTVVQRVSAAGGQPEPLTKLVALYTVFYNFVKIHKTLRVTPAMQAGLVDRVLTFEEIAAMIEANAIKPGPRGPYTKRNSN